jgi:hypothetical protein
MKIEYFFSYQPLSIYPAVFLDLRQPMYFSIRVYYPIMQNAEFNCIFNFDPSLANRLSLYPGEISLIIKGQILELNEQAFLNNGRFCDVDNIPAFFSNYEVGIHWSHIEEPNTDAEFLIPPSKKFNYLNLSLGRFYYRKKDNTYRK